MNGYGPTETTITATLYEPKEGEQTQTGSSTCVPIGRPIPGVRVRVVDGHRGLAARGVGGELWIGGEGVARGYWAEEQKTAEKFVADPWGEAGERVYRTGDRVRYGSDGNLEFLGRLDGQVKVRGFRIEPGEIEAVLEQAAGVRESAVVARGEGGQTRLVAYVAPGAAGVTGSQLREHVKQRLPGYMVPAQVVVMGALPRTESGKVDRRRLPEPEESREAQEGYVAPQTPLEEKVARIWSELLHREAVGVTDNFFDLGGHSLLATQVISRVREAFSLELPLRTLFEAPTVGQLALAIAQAQAQATSPEELLRMLEEIEKQEPGDPRPV
jgi:acyl carrier protein